MDLRYMGDDVLRQKAASVADIDDKLSHIIEAMFDVMNASRGVGLAAPQVGISQRFFICHAPDDEPRIFINPEIIATSPELSAYEEGCLSIPGIYADVVRPAKVEVQAWDLRGRPFKLEADGFLARVIQHEYDHLNGVLFLDRLPSKKRTRLENMFFKQMARGDR